ncbi:SMI1/KNR4 family protein [uncultured Imperialibacter sp.]|uniref:SMI1/KNR4 family protein n=1 Tax=uncultured Imperialibacter sp. TaxID=1672639 RepID=UPI0030DA3F77|tara:strand:- start:125506 stop:125976 length:471 start_codon:yes stop_codon:yes gene_type:complete
MAKFSQCEQFLNSRQIQEIEQYVGFDFPRVYKEHLLAFNGGKCSPNVFQFGEGGKITRSTVDWFLAIYDGKYDNLKRYIEIYKKDSKRLPGYMLPIAHDPGGNLICLSCAGEDNGQVFFWDHEKEVDYTTSDDSDYSNLYFIAGSLQEFLESLQEI